MTMNPEIKAKWLKRLRSGEYEQGTKGHLCTIDDEGNREYCCLGVLAEIAVEHGIIPAPRKAGSCNYDPEHECAEECSEHYGYLEYDGNSEYLDNITAGWAGIPGSPDGDAEPENESVQHKLAVMNDGDETIPTSVPKTFVEIADWIEENL